MTTPILDPTDASSVQSYRDGLEEAIWKALRPHAKRWALEMHKRARSGEILLGTFLGSWRTMVGEAVKDMAHLLTDQAQRTVLEALRNDDQPELLFYEAKEILAKSRDDKWSARETAKAFSAAFEVGF